MGKNVLKKELCFWYKASVASSFSKSSIGVGFILHYPTLICLRPLSFYFFPYSLFSIRLFLSFFFGLSALCVFFRLHEFHSFPSINLYSLFVFFSYFSLLSSKSEHNVFSHICYHFPSAVFVTSFYPTNAPVSHQ